MKESDKYFYILPTISYLFIGSLSITIVQNKFIHSLISVRIIYVSCTDMFMN